MPGPGVIATTSAAAKNRRKVWKSGITHSIDIIARITSRAGKCQVEACRPKCPKEGHLPTCEGRRLRWSHPRRTTRTSDPHSALRGYGPFCQFPDLSFRAYPLGKALVGRS